MEKRRTRREENKDRVFTLQECGKKEKDDGKSEGEKADKKKTLTSNLIMQYLEHQKEQIIKAISRTYEKEVTIDVSDDTPEVKEIQSWRQQAKRRKLLKKQQKVEDRLRHKREKGRKKKHQEEGHVDNKKKVGKFFKTVTAFPDGYGDLSMAVM